MLELSVYYISPPDKSGYKVTYFFFKDKIKPVFSDSFQNMSSEMTTYVFQKFRLLFFINIINTSELLYILLYLKRKRIMMIIMCGLCA